MSDSSSKNTRIAKNTLFLYLRMFFVLLVSLYTTRVVLNALGVVDYGVYNVVAGFVAMFAFLNTSMSNGIQRFYNFKLGSEGEAALTKVYNTSLLIQGILSIIVVLLLETIGLWYINEKMVIPLDRMDTARWLYHFSVISLVLVIMQIPYSSAIIAHERMGFFALVSIIDAVAKLIIALILPYVGSDKLFVYGIYSLGIAIINFVLYYAYNKIHFKELLFRIEFDRELFISMLSFSGWNVFGTFAFMIRQQGLTILLNFFFGTVVNAAQGIAAQIQSAIQGFSGNIVVAFRPQMVQSYAQGDYGRVSHMFCSLSKISFLMLFMLSAPVAFEIDYILKLWLGDAVPEYTSYFTIMVLANMVLLSLHTPIVTLIHASGQMKKFQIVTSLIICSIIPISWVALKMGAEPGSVYWISLIVQIVNQAACMKVLLDVFPYHINDYIKNVIMPILIVSLVVILCEFGVSTIMPECFMRLIITCAVSFIVTCGTAYLSLTENEKNIIFNIIKRKKE